MLHFSEVFVQAPWPGKASSYTPWLDGAGGCASSLSGVAVQAPWSDRGTGCALELAIVTGWATSLGVLSNQVGL